MIRLFQRTALAALLAGVAVPAAAQQVALVIQNGPYASLPDAEVADFERLTLAYEGAGFEVLSGENLTRTELFTLLNTFRERAEAAEKVVIHLSGQTATSGNESWFLPADANADTVIRVGLTAPTLDLLLGLTAGEGRHGVMFVGTDPEAGIEGAGVEAGIGRVYTPRDTLLIHGPVGEIDTLAREVALIPGTSLRDLVSEMTDTMTSAGFADPEAVVIAQDGLLVAEPVLIEGADELETAAAPPAPAPEPEPEPEPEEEENPAEAAEAALNLDRDARRAIQEDLVLMGFNTRGVDGIFGPGTRAAIVGWQQGQDFEQTSYLSASQVELLSLQGDNRRAEIEAEQERQRAEREAEDRAFWESSGALGTEEGLRAYLRSYPNGLFSDEAGTALAEIEAEQLAAASAEVQAAWNQALQTDTADGYRAFLASFPDSEFAPTAQARLQQFEEQAQREVAATNGGAAAGEQALGLNLVNRTLVQARLRSLGYSVPSISGEFDADTREALAQFQREYGLEPTGFLNEATVRQLIVLAPPQ